mgnify:CR=1 FL=1|tara:strand:+ start:5325 stop:6029 length:705 start_codon:yes stop_codon:yes gene_type:complete
MPIKLITLNVEGKKHLKKIISFLTKESPEVICLQELFQTDFKKIKEELKTEGIFYPMYERKDTTNYGSGTIGVGIITKLPFTNQKGTYYIDGINDQSMTPRVLVSTTILKNNKEYNIGTTHFEWTPNSQPSERQRKAASKIIEIISKYPKFILCGDFNAPRGGEIYTSFSKELKDNLPKEINSTLDPDHHPNGHLNIVVDTIFTKGNYKVTNIKTTQNLSDHKAIIGEISHQNT